jgi:hypothetical protein
MTTTTLTVPLWATADAVKQVLRDPILRARLREGRRIDLWCFSYHRRPARLTLSGGINGAVRLSR